VKLQVSKFRRIAKSYAEHLLAKETAASWCFRARSRNAADRGELERRWIAVAQIHGESLAITTHIPRWRDSNRGLSNSGGDGRGFARNYVQDIVHVINYDLPEIAETLFIVWAVRDGAAKKAWLPPLITRDQRGEIFQMERTLGLKMEKLQANLERLYCPAAEARVQAGAAGRQLRAE